MRFDVQPLRKRYDAVIVPPIWVQSRDELEERARELRSHTPLLKQLASRSSIMASACSGAILLADAGLLAGYKATTCWWLAESLQRRFPDIQVLPDKLIVTDADRWTAAAGSAYMHLGLALVNKFAGSKAAAATARLLLVERRRGSQSPFMSSQRPTVEIDDPRVRRAVRYMDNHLGERITIAQMCNTLAVNERTLVRQFKVDLGVPPLAFLQSRRLARAKLRLEETSLPLMEIVQHCGYEDIASFRKLFTRHVGMTPREYRSRFGRVV